MALINEKSQLLMLQLMVPEARMLPVLITQLIMKTKI